MRASRCAPDHEFSDSLDGIAAGPKPPASTVTVVRHLDPSNSRLRTAAVGSPAVNAHEERPLLALFNGKVAQGQDVGAPGSRMVKHAVGVDVRNPALAPRSPHHPVSRSGPGAVSKLSINAHPDATPSTARPPLEWRLPRCLGGL